MLQASSEQRRPKEQRPRAKAERQTLILGTYEDILKQLQTQQALDLEAASEELGGLDAEGSRQARREIEEAVDKARREIEALAGDRIVPSPVIQIGEVGEGTFFTAAKEMPKAERLEGQELIEATVNAENELASQLIARYPERADEINGRLEAKRRLRQPIAESAEISGKSKNKPLKIKCADGTEAAFKPVSREEPDLARGIEAGTYAAREWLAEQIDAALGTGLVPATILRQGPEGLGSAQEWQNDCQVAMGVDYWEAPRSEMLKLALFDALTRNVDRHAGNFMVRNGSQKLVAIDSAMIFSSDPSDKSWSAPLREVGGQKLTSDDFAELESSLENFTEATEIQQTLRNAFTIALGEQGTQAWNQFLERINDFRKSKTLPKSEL